MLDQLRLPLPGKPLLLHLQGSFTLRLLLVRLDLQLALLRTLLFLTAQFLVALDRVALLLFLSAIDFLLALILRPLLILLNLPLLLLGSFAFLPVQLLPMLVRETLLFRSLTIQFLLTLLLRALPILFHLALLLLGALALFSA